MRSSLAQTATSLVLPLALTGACSPYATPDAPEYDLRAGSPDLTRVHDSVVMHAARVTSDFNFDTFTQGDEYPVDPDEFHKALAYMEHAFHSVSDPPSLAATPGVTRTFEYSSGTDDESVVVMYGLGAFQEFGTSTRISEGVARFVVNAGLYDQGSPDLSVSEAGVFGKSDILIRSDEGNRDDFNGELLEIANDLIDLGSPFQGSIQNPDFSPSAAITDCIGEPCAEPLNHFNIVVSALKDAAPPSNFFLFTAHNDVSQVAFTFNHNDLGLGLSCEVGLLSAFSEDISVRIHPREDHVRLEWWFDGENVHDAKNVNVAPSDPGFDALSSLFSSCMSDTADISPALDSVLLPE